MKWMCFFGVVVLLAVGGAAQGSMFTLPAEKMELSLLAYTPIGGGSSELLPTVAASLLKQTGRNIDCPTNRHEILPWANDNLRATVAFEAEDLTTLKYRGAGFAEQVKVGSLWDAPVMGGVAYLTGSGWNRFIGFFKPL